MSKINEDYQRQGYTRCISTDKNNNENSSIVSHRNPMRSNRRGTVAPTLSDLTQESPSQPQPPTPAFAYPNSTPHGYYYKYGHHHYHPHQHASYYYYPKVSDGSSSPSIISSPNGGVSVPPSIFVPQLTNQSNQEKRIYEMYPFLPPTPNLRSGSNNSAKRIEEPRHFHHRHHRSNHILEINDNDVLCGRGAPTSWHPGNQHFRDLVKSHQSSYLASRRGDKPLIASRIIDMVKSRGGRFLRRYKRGGVTWERKHFVWVEIDEERAYEKACQALREGAPEIRRQMILSSSDTKSSTTDNGELEDRESTKSNYVDGGVSHQD